MGLSAGSEAESQPPLRLRELLAQGPAELEVTAREALLRFPYSSCSLSRQRRVGAGRAPEEQLQCSPSPSQEQEGPRLPEGGCGGGENGQGAPLPSPPHRGPLSDVSPLPHLQTSSLAPGTPTPHSPTTERLREAFWEPRGF